MSIANTRDDRQHTMLTLPVTVRYGYPTDIAPLGELFLEGSFDGLRELSTILRSNITQHLYQLYIPESSSPKPYDNFISVLQIIKGDGKVQITGDNHLLIVSGDLENLKILADNILAVAEETQLSGDIHQHLHLEYYPEHYFLTPTSLPLVVVRK